MIREIFLMMHYNFLKETLKTRFNITLPIKEAYHHLSGDVELVEIPLKDIRFPCGNRRSCPIPESNVYKWIKSKKTSYFRNYNEANVWIPDNTELSQKRFNNLNKSLEDEGYDPSRCVITLRKNNILIDGRHRCAALYNQFGGDHKILVVREK